MSGNVILLGWDGEALTRVQTDSAGRLYAVPGFESVVAGAKSDASAAAGDNTLTSDAVPAGTVWVITHLAAFDDDNSVSSVHFRVTHDGVARVFSYQGAKAAQITGEWSGELYLDAGDTVDVVLGGVTLNDLIVFAYYGYQIEAP